MKKFLKSLLGRPFVVLAALIVQVGFVIVVALLLHSHSLLPLTVAEVVAVIACVHLVNRDMPPEGKISWLILLLVVPVCGLIVYLLFSHNKMSGRQRRRLAKLNAKTASFVNCESCCDQATKDKLQQYFGQAQYLATASNAQIFCASSTQYLKDGLEFWQDLLSQLSKAERFIFLEFFIVERGQMWNEVLKLLKKKVAQGVEVRMLYDDFGTLGKLPFNYFKHLQKLGIRCAKFNPIVPVVSAIHNNRDHRKIVVIDGKVGYVGGSNLADEYINKKVRFGYWKDCALKIEGNAVKSLTIMFLQLFDLQTKNTDGNWEKYIEQNQTEKCEQCGCVVPFGDGPKPMYSEHISEQALLNLINQAQHYLYVTTPYLVLDERLKGALCSAAKRGVDVAIVTPEIPDKKFVFMMTRFNYLPLQKAGVKIFQFSKGFMHGKSIVADDCVAIVGTINLDYRSLLHHFECGVWLYQTKSVAQLKEDLDNTISQSTLQPEKVQSALHRFVAKLAMLFAPLL